VTTAATYAPTRPVPGRAFVRIGLDAGVPGQLPSMVLNAMPAPHTDGRAYAVEGQVAPGGGRAV